MAIIASLLRWRRSTARHRFSGCGDDTSPGSDSTTYQAPSDSSVSSWPGPQPAYPAKIRSEPRSSSVRASGDEALQIIKRLFGGGQQVPPEY